MSDPIDAVGDKVLAIFKELVGERASQIDGSVLATQAREAVAEALTADKGAGDAAKIALHMTDWNWDAAFVVALCLFPERFTAEEIDAGIGLFLCHAPNHIREACRLTGTYVWETFPEEDEVIPEFVLSLPSIGVTQFPEKGRGVVAMRHFEPGESVERLPVIVIPREEVSLMRQTRLANYYFEWGDDCQQAAVALGYGSLYNHSYTPNARYEFREPEECLEIVALREIKYGEEITLNYNNLGPSANNALKFDVKE